jgi:hypothetical protein
MFLGLAANKIMGPLVRKFNEHGFIAIVMYICGCCYQCKPGQSRVHQLSISIKQSGLCRVWVLLSNCWALRVETWWIYAFSPD